MTHWSMGPKAEETKRKLSVAALGRKHSARSIAAASAARTRPLEERLWTRIDKTDGCWLWKGHLSNGYGCIGEGGRKGRDLLVHRVVYELLRGPIPHGLELDHLCRDRACCNPDHLEPVPHRENSRRSPTIGRWKRPDHCRNGHPFDEANTYWTREDGRACRQCKRDSAARIRVRGKAA
jgi:HNH endonuclease